MISNKEKRKSRILRTPSKAWPPKHQRKVKVKISSSLNVTLSQNQKMDWKPTKSLEYPFDCELCDAKLENEKDMKEDLRFYRYKNIFLNVKTLTMCVKNFCLRRFMLESSMLEIIECGLCNFEAKDIEHMWRMYLQNQAFAWNKGTFK